MLRRNPGSTFAIAGLLALGIGASTAIFSVFDAVLLRPLPVRHPEQLVRMVQRQPVIGSESLFNYSYYETLRDHATTLASVFAEYGEYEHYTLTEPAPSEQITVYAVTPEFFDALGVQAIYGRVLTAADAKDTGTPPAVVSYGFWQRRFDGDPQALGRTLVIHGHPFVVAGVLPREFNGMDADTAPDVRVPVRAYPLLTDHPVEQGTGFGIEGRLKPGVTREQAESECLSLWQANIRELLKDRPKLLASELQTGMALDPLDRGFSILRDRFGNALKVLMAFVGLLLLLVRSTSRVCCWSAPWPAGKRSRCDWRSKGHGFG